EGAAVRPIWHLVPATDWACTPQPRRFAAPWWALIPRHLGSQRDAYPVGGRLRGGSGIDDSYPHLRHSLEPQEPNASRWLSRGKPFHRKLHLAFAEVRIIRPPCQVLRSGCECRNCHRKRV